MFRPRRGLSREWLVQRAGGHGAREQRRRARADREHQEWLGWRERVDERRPQ